MVVRVLFNVRNIRAENWLKNESGNLIRQIVDDQKTMIREHLRSGMQAGINPREVALDLVGRVGIDGKRSGGAVGLTSSQEKWVKNYRSKLSDPSRLKEALENKLRDKRFDGTINKAAAGDKGLTPKQIEAMVRNYRNRALKYRADAIGRTEALRSLNKSAEEATMQAIESGQLSADNVEKVWIATSDGKTRDTHRKMNGQTVPFYASFVSPSGARLKYPGDETAPGEETINCRCTWRPKIDFLAGIT